VTDDRCLIFSSTENHTFPAAEDSNTTEEMQIRLVNGPNHCAGRIEVFHNGQWGTVCDDSWNLRSAKVVCRQLGCGTAVSAPGKAHFGRGSDPIWLDDVECSGTEASLSQCRLNNWGNHNCNHEEDAAVVCSGDHRDDAGTILRNTEVLHKFFLHWDVVSSDLVPRHHIMCRCVR